MTDWHVGQRAELSYVRWWGSLDCAHCGAKLEVAGGTSSREGLKQRLPGVVATGTRAEMERLRLHLAAVGEDGVVSHDGSRR